MIVSVRVNPSEDGFEVIPYWRTTDHYLRIGQSRIVNTEVDAGEIVRALLTGELSPTEEEHTPQPEERYE